MTVLRRYKDSARLLAISLCVVLLAGWLFGLVWSVVLSLLVGASIWYYDSLQKGGVWGRCEYVMYVIGLILGILIVARII